MRCVIPVYTYQCEECGLQFEKRRKASKAQAPLKCECGAQVSLAVPSTMNSTFHVAGDGGVGPQNTGVSAYDANVDRVIGEHAASSWKSIDARLNHKKDILRKNPNASGYDLSRKQDGDYRIMSSKERKAAETARNLHNRALHLIKKRNAQKKKGGK